ncbi:flagellin [Alkalicoccus urumqiensis]|uniref:Flagellin n=1 Tax=Alkalicoccus urumqiensis TaxID=1548213 RepID=A0A2P6MKC8_ALKUR|nr:flagellin [Alkalicoccus urumqiensis]PRO66740.1 flagellin [Alkalicoccus urumqiensis]
MKINNNIQALNAYRNLNQNQGATAKNLEKLSSGLRINRAADDAAGLAISEKMRSQIRGLKMAERNAMDGISLIQTSEGAMQEIHEMLQRMRELATQGANDTNTDQDREEIQKEIDQLLTEIDSVAEKTEFNTRKLLNGESAILSTIDNDSNAAGLTRDPVVTDASLRSGSYALETTGTEIVREVVQPGAGISAVDGDTDAERISFTDSGPDSENTLGTYTINVTNLQRNEDGDAVSASVEVTGPDGLPRGEKKEIVLNSDTPQDEEVGGLTIGSDRVAEISKSGTLKVSLEAKATFNVTQQSLTDDEFVSIAADKEITTVNGKIKHGGMEFQFDSSISDSADQETQFDITNNALAFQIGPNTNQSVNIDIPQLSAVELGIDSISVTTQKEANDTIFALDGAIQQVSSLRAKLGAVQNRMEHTINNLQVTHENLSSSESRIRDADMAEEMTEFTRNNILNQSATAMLAQANQLPQGVLQLLQ